MFQIYLKWFKSFWRNLKDQPLYIRVVHQLKGGGDKHLICLIFRHLLVELEGKKICAVSFVHVEVLTITRLTRYFAFFFYIKVPAIIYLLPCPLLFSKLFFTQEIVILNICIITLYLTQSIATSTTVKVMIFPTVTRKGLKFKKLAFNHAFIVFEMIMLKIIL